MAAGSPVSLSGACAFTALEAASEIRAGRLDAAQYCEQLLERIDALEPRVRAWAWLDRESAREQARAVASRIAELRETAPLGLLAGVPVGIKDIIDVRGMPTEDGTVLHAGRIACDDATLVAHLREAGAWPIGKTVTTELATYAPGKTRNPHDLARTPGGSSSGSAAAVACGMVPLAIGTQTNGSVIRPAAYCGVVGYKPRFGLVSRSGVLEQSPPLDQIGVFARSVEDAAALVQAICGSDVRDPATREGHVEALAQAAASDPPCDPRIAWARTPWWTRIAPDARTALDGWAHARGDVLAPVELPEEVSLSVAFHRTVMEADIAGSFEREYERGRARLSESLRGQIERGRCVTAVDHRKALSFRPVLLAALSPLFDAFDVIATPATLGTAPALEQGTGDPLMCTPWTFAGLPMITLPLARAADAMPVGVQLVGAPGDDARLLRTARWLMRAG